MTRSTRTLLLLVALSGSASVALAGNWERFRGPNGTGTVDDKDVPVKFSASQNMIWKVAIPGTGNSSPIVWGNRLFLHMANPKATERPLLCIDTANGKTLWQKSIPGTPVKLSRPDTSHASATPATDGEAVYVPFWNGREIIVTAYDFSGMELWHKNLGVFNSQHGAGAS